MSGCSTEYSPIWVCPTAHRSLDEVPSIAFRWFSKLAVSGLGMTSHALRFQRVVKVLNARLPGTLWVPIAQASPAENALIPMR
jgi:hypothetical protein